jgi:ABC-type transport system substrate-binding protein
VIGTKLADRYEIVSELGRGGMGVVYRAHDPRLNREVAVKCVPPQQLSPDAEPRFQREAQLVAQMDHPAIVSIHDFGHHEGSLFFVMPLVQGTNLRAFLRHEEARLGDVLDVGIQLAEALEYSHARGVVHRDLKPENVMVAREEGAGIRVRVMDFGLARASSESRLTRTGTLVGTLAYLSPEQVAAKEVDGRSDVYALGTVLYECVAGGPPFSGETQSVLYRIVHEFPQPPREAGAEIDEELEQIILSCLHKEPGRRPQRAGDVAEALKRYRSRLRESDRGRAVAGLTQSMQAPRVAHAPLVGRASELAELQKRLNAAVSGECQLVVVSGEPGVGKTRLLDEIESLARARGIRVLHGRSVERDRSFPYQGFCDAIQEYFRYKDEASSAAPDFSDLAGDLLALFPMLTEIGEIRAAASGSAQAAGSGAGAAENQTQVFELLARTLTRIAGGKPLVLVMEDLHAAEVSLEALQYIVRRLGPTATLVLGSYRTSEVDRRHPLTRVLEGFRGDRRFAAIPLGALLPAEHRAFVETLVGGTGLTDSLAQRLYEGTEGNPFFTKELVRSLLGSGAIAADATGQWTLSGEALSAEAMPATIQEAVEGRIRRLPEELRQLLATASVLGRSFDVRDLEALAEGEVEDALDRLLVEGYLEEPREARGDVLAFSSGVVRDVLYASLSPRKRRSLHRRSAERLEARHSGRLERVLPQLVHHYFNGDVPEKTVEHGLRLAGSSLDAWSAEEAARSARMALAFLDDEWEGDRALEAEARLLLARAHRMGGDIEGALREAAAAVSVHEREGRAAAAASSLLFAAETAWHARRSDEAGRFAEKGLVAARLAGEPAVLRSLLSLAATLANLRGDYERAKALVGEADALGARPRSVAGNAAPAAGGRLVVALVNPAKSIEPGTIQTNEEAEVAANVYETLLATGPDGNLVPGLCERWEPLEGGHAFRLALRRDVRFSDGRALTAADVKASFEASVRLAQEELPSALSAVRGAAEHRAGTAQGIAGLVVSGDHEMEIRLLEPLPIFPALLTEVSTGVMRPGESGALGTGPFRMASRAADRIVLERNPGYWREPRALLDALEFRSFPSANAIAATWRSGEVDLARDLLPEDLEEILRDPRLRRGLVEAPKKNTYFVLFNCRSGPLASRAGLRRALSGVVRAQDLVWRTLGRFAEPATGLIPPAMVGHDPGRRSAVLTREEALALLGEDGVFGPARLRAMVHPLFHDRYAALLAALRGQWAELGVEVAVETPDMAAYLHAWEASDGLDLLIGRWNADYDDPDNVTHTLFHSRTGLLRSYFSSAEADRILEEARSESRLAARESLYRRFEALLAQGGALLPLFHDIDYRLASERVHGLRLRGIAPYVNYVGIGTREAAEPEPEVRPTTGGSLHVPMSGVVTSLDPASTETLDQADLVPLLFETLTRDAGGAAVVPWLAAEFLPEEGGRKYRFRLRDGVRFGDGRRLTARDVRYSFERLLRSNGDSRFFFAPMRGARALLAGETADLAGFRIHSATEFTIELEEPVAFFPALMSYPSVAIVPEGADPSVPGAWAGTGPFRVAAFEPGRRLVLEPNRSYWRKGYPRSEGLTLSFGVSPGDMLAGFRAGRFALASDLFPADVEALRHEPRFMAGYRESPRLLTYFAVFNSRQGPLADQALRHRLAGAVDVPRAVRQHLGRLAIPAVGLIPPGLLGYESAPVRAASPAGVGERPSPVELTAVVHPVFMGNYADLARDLAGAFAEKGVRLRVVNKTMTEYEEAITHGTVDLAVGRWGADYPDADTFVYILHSTGGFLGRLCGSPEIDRLAERGRAETAPVQRHALYRQVEDKVAREALLLPLFHEQAYRFAQPDVGGLSVSFGIPLVAYEELHLRG